MLTPARREPNDGSHRQTDQSRQSEEIARGPATLPVNPRWTGLALGGHTATGGSQSNDPRDRVSQPGDPGVREVIGAPGEPLPDGVRTTMEGRFGRDLGAVRVHTGAAAAESAATLDASAYTVGRHMVFGAGRFAPATPPGAHLLAHELTHVVQQEGVPDVAPHGQLPVTRPGDSAERAADATAHAVVHGQVAPPALLGAAPAAGPTIARGPRDALPAADPQGPQRPNIAHHSYSEGRRVERGSIEELIDYTAQDYDEQGVVFDRKKLVYTRTVRVVMAGEFTAVMEMKGKVILPLSADAARVAALTGEAGRGHLDVNVHVEDMRGPMSGRSGFDFAYRAAGGYPPANDFLSLRTMAARGPDYVHFDLAPEVQIDTLVAEVRRRLPPPRVPKPEDVTEEEFQRMTPDERAELAREALGEEFKLSNVAKAILIALGIFAAILAAIFLATVGWEALVVGLVIVAIGAAIFALVSTLWDTISDVISRFADSDIGGAILSILKGLAIAAGIILGAIAVVVAILGAPLEVGAVLLFAAIALGIGLLLAYHDYSKAKTAPDLAHFRKDIQRSARGFEGAISDAVVLALTAIVGEAAKPGGPSDPAGGPSVPGTDVPSSGPIIIEPPRVAPAAPPVPEIPQVAPAAPPIPETPQVAGPTVMVPNVTPPEVVTPPAGTLIKPAKPTTPRARARAKPPAPTEPEPPVKKPAKDPRPSKGDEPARPGPAKATALPEDPQQGVRDALARTNQKIAEADKEIAAHGQEVTDAQEKVQTLYKKRVAANRKDPSTAQLQEELDAARKRMTELNERQQHRISENTENRATRDRLQNALDEKTYARPKFTEAERAEVWKNAQDADGRVFSPSGKEIKPGDRSWIMGHKPKYEFRKHVESAARRAITRDQFLQENKKLSQYRPETAEDSASHLYEDKTDAYLGP
jgi:hypothetical protein